ncbi:ornithine carbamoyltransferase [Tistlia consotensis]|uniref:Ornithine carbamoyltransferase n=1 Tax=Tistlia consotensis USBA 355 TaxID=560819 RepID=A0A1Y6BL89_9PROT|nr:ornithine carbamoyltransferase [Tistlia consotensis]SMF06900.1 ornithine carbamoyltransferase [Tistlia consotensis USBA 355]SNR36227.1 ornithine carbamoyltransferase [Tistlia consotensis]
MAPKSATPKHFLDLDRFDSAGLRTVLELGKACKSGATGADRPLAGKALAMIFEKPSTRTRVSFELGIRQLGGEAIVLEPSGSQLGRGETIADTARVLSRYVDAIMIRTTREEKLLELAEYATVPVINGLTDRTHPCQLMADVMTFEEHRGPIAGKVIAWSGDGNNMATSWIQAAVRFGFELRLACPGQLQPPEEIVAWAAREGGRIVVTEDPVKAMKDADCVVTDTWVSMGDDVGDSIRRHNILRPYQVDERMMALARPDAIFMHCLPAHRGQEVTEAVIDGPQSVIWDEAENRLHAQKGILLWCLGTE